MSLRELAYDVNATILGSEDFKALVGVDSRYGGVLALVNPNGDEHYIYPTAGYKLSAGNRTQMMAGTEGVNLVASPVNTGSVSVEGRRSPGINVFGSDDRISQLLAIGEAGPSAAIRGGLGFLRVGGADSPVILYFTDAHVPTLGTVAQYKAGTGGTALGIALAGPFSKADPTRSGITTFSGPVILAGKTEKPSALFLGLGGITAVMAVWVTPAGTALAAGSPQDWNAL